MKRRYVVALIAIALGAGVLLLRPARQSAPPAPAVRVAAPAESPAAPYSARADYPNVEAPRGPVAEAEAEAEQPPREAPPPPPVMRFGPPAAPAAPPPTSTLSTLFGEYRDAVCACTTRTCVRQLQGKFIRRLSTASYDQARDGDAKDKASLEAYRCLEALPEHS